MSKSSRRKKQSTFLPWLTNNPNGYHDNEERFLQVPQNMFMDKRLHELNDSAFRLYFCMACESGGKFSFEFSHSDAKKYGFNHNTFDACVKELIFSKMIEEIQNDELSKFKTKEFRFTPECWKVLCSHDFKEARKKARER